MTQQTVNNNNDNARKSLKRPLIITAFGLVILIALVIVTSEISKRNILAFVTNDLKYILSLEITILVVFLIEAAVRLIAIGSHHTELSQHSTSWRLIVRIVGYTLGVVSIISILASNNTLGISVGAIAGVVVAFATQNIASSVLSAILIVSTRMIKVGEEITISGISGTVADISLTHTVIAAGDDIVLVPNSFMMANIVRRKKRHIGGSGVSQ